MVAPWIKKKRAAQTAKKNNKKTTPVAKATATVTETPKAPAVTVATVAEVVEETVVETTDTAEESVDIHSMYKWQLVAHAEGLGHDVTGLTKTEIISLLEQG